MLSELGTAAQQQRLASFLRASLGLRANARLRRGHVDAWQFRQPSLLDNGFVKVHALEVHQRPFWLGTHRQLACGQWGAWLSGRQCRCTLTTQANTLLRKQTHCYYSLEVWVVKY